MENFDLNKNEESPASVQWWRTLAILYTWRRFILVMSFLTALATAGIVWFFLPNVYSSSASLLLPPASGAGGLAQALTGRGLSAVANLLGGAGGDYVRYMGILQSRRVLEAVVKKYDLIRAYKIQEPEGAARDMEKAIATFSDNLKVEIDEKLEYLVVQVTDEDPRKAAEMANFMVDELNRISGELFSANARTYRMYMENRYLLAKKQLDSLQQSMQAFQQRNGVIELPTQVEAFYKSMADYRLEIAKAEIQARTLSEQLGPENVQVKAAQSAYEKAQEQLRSFMAGGDQMMQVSFDELPAVSREYGQLYQNMLVQAKIIESLTPLYEQANFDEKKQTVAVQVLDRAIPAAKKSGPPRTIIVLAAAFSALILSMIFAIAYEALRQNQAGYALKLSKAVNHLKPNRFG